LAGGMQGGLFCVALSVRMRRQQGRRRGSAASANKTAM
jgi:hypothetical protein